MIGAGAGGLAAAGRLARAGLDVHVLEKNAEVCGPAWQRQSPRCRNTMCADSKLVFVLVQVGGRVQSAASPDGTFRFDTGPSLLLFPDK